MPPVAEIRHYFEGAWRLARGDTGGMAHFDFSVDGFWRSFWALVIVAPGYAVIVADQYSRQGEPVPFWPTLIGESLSYLLRWATLPLVAILLTRFFGVAGRYVPLIVVLNWSSLVQLVVLLVPIALSVLLSAEATWLLLFVATGLVLFYQGFVIKTALDCPVGIAVAFLAADLIVAMFLNSALMSIVLG